MVGVRMLLSQLDHGRAHGRGLGLALLQAGVEGNHEVLGTLVVHVPEAQNERLSPRLQKAAGQPDQLIARGDDVQSRRASAEHYQLGW